MDSAVYVAIMVATAASIGRTVWVLIAFARTLARSNDSVEIQWDWPFFVVAPESVLPAVVALWLLYDQGAAPPYSLARELCAPLGAIAALSGLALTTWSWLSLPSVGSGHYLLEGQPLITSGAYGFVRNPIYSGAFLIWLGLAAAYTSVVTLLLTILYVIPAYVLYIKAEERMLLTRYGEEYRVYRRRVGSLMPRIRRP